MLASSGPSPLCSRRLPPRCDLRDRRTRSHTRTRSTPVVAVRADPTAAIPPVDRATVLQLLSRVLQDLYGAMGGPVAFGEVDVVDIAPARLGDDINEDSKSSSEVVIRFPAG